jgi:hypothetical protein
MRVLGGDTERNPRDKLSHELADAQHALEVQFTRIAQMQ